MRSLPGRLPASRWVGTLAFLALALSLAPAEAQACPVCFGWTEGQGRAGYYWSLLLLSLLPFVAILVVGLRIRRLNRRTEDAAGPDPVAGRPRTGS